MVKAATAERYSNTRTDLIGADVGRRIRAARLERGMSLADLGADDLSRSFLSLVELGRSRISLRALSIVAERLGLPVSYFLDDAPGVTDAALELVLDQAEAALARQNPTDCLKALDEATIPERMRLREWWLRGRALVDSGQPRAAIPILEEALALAEKRGDIETGIHLHYKLGAALYASGNMDEALVHLRRTIDDASKHLQDPVLLGKTTVVLGHIMYLRGEIDGAIEQYSRARDLFSTISDLDNMGTVYSGLSLAYKRRGDLINALQYSKRSVAVFEAKQNARQAAREMNNLAVSFQQIGDLSQAAEYARESVQRAQQIHAPEVEAAAHGTLAAIHLRLGETEVAELEAQAADDLAQTDTDLARIDAWLVLAEVAEHKNDPARADALYQRAFTALQSMGMHVAYADAALAYSRLLQRRGETNRALEFAIQAAEARATRSA